MKKILPFALIVCVLMSICFIPSSDADGESLWVNGVNAVSNPGSLPAGCTFDSVNNVLTLNNVGNLTTTSSISYSGTQNAVIIDNRSVTPGLTITITGDDNNITCAGSGNYHGIFVTGDLTINGTGELTVTTANDGGSGIASFGALTINGPSISAAGGLAPDIMGMNGITISAGSVVADLDSNDGITISGSSSVDSDLIMSTSGTVSISGTSVVDVEGGSIRAENGDMAISGSSSILASQLWVEETLTIEGSPVIIAGDIFANMDITDTDTFTMSGGSVSILADGNIDVDGCVNISGGTITFAGDLPDVDAGIIAMHPTITPVITLTGGTISVENATAGRSLVYASAGELVCTGSNPLNNLAISGSSLVVQNAGAASISFPVVGYTVSFNANGGSGSMASTIKNGSYALPENGFTAPTGKEFKCWSVTIGSAAAVEKNPGQTVDVTADTTVKAIWQDIPVTKYTVSFDANGGTGTMASVTDVSGEYTLPECAFTAPEGKTFKCWSVGDTEKNVGDKITVSADTTVKAVWKDSSSPSSGGGEFPTGIVVGAVIGGIAVIGIAVFVLKKMGKF